jgi:hypothetical protein
MSNPIGLLPLVPRYELYARRCADSEVELDVVVIPADYDSWRVLIKDVKYDLTCLRSARRERLRRISERTRLEDAAERQRERVSAQAASRRGRRPCATPDAVAPAA